MPKAWSKKDERQYKAINKSCSKKKKCARLKTKAGRASCRKTCKRMASATVNKQRKKEGRTLKGLGAWKERQEFGACNIIAYHGTYKARAANIQKHGLKPGGQGEIWLTRSAKAAWTHAARRAALDGCGHAPLTVLKVRVVGVKGVCPVYRPVHTSTLMTNVAIPKSRILGTVARDPDAVEEGRQRAVRQKRIRARPTRCPPRRRR